MQAPADVTKEVVQATADGTEEVTPVQPVAESKPEESAEEGVVSTLKKSKAAAAEREAGEQVHPSPSKTFAGRAAESSPSLRLP